jgi:hypothetical protein
MAGTTKNGNSQLINPPDKPFDKLRTGCGAKFFGRHRKLFATKLQIIYTI